MIDLTNLVKGKETRQIDIDYQTAMAAKNTQEIYEVNSKLLELQAAKSCMNLEQQKKTNQSLGELKEVTSHLTESMEAINKNVDHITHQVDFLADEVTDLKLEIQQGFKLVIDILEKQHSQLEDIKNFLSRPYETAVLELRNSANYWLLCGMRDSGEDQNKYFKDSIQLLNQCLENPVGKRDYVVWFQKGWLLWKHTGDLNKAEETFSEARRLSKPKLDLYYQKSLRHLAYIQYLNDKPEKAYQTIQQAVNTCKDDDHDTLFDAARYAARNGYKKEALKYLNQCINLRPETSVTMFAEEDFICS